MSGGGRTPSEDFYSRQRDNTEGLGNQSVEEDDDIVSEKQTEDANPKEAMSKEDKLNLIAQALVKVLEG